MDLTNHFRPEDRAPAAPSPAAVRLAAALAERLGAIVPVPFRVRAEGGWVTRYRGAEWEGSSDVAGVLDHVAEPRDDEPQDDEWSFAERVTTVAWSVLSSVQDGVAEATAEPWPKLPQGGMANPGTREDGVLVYLWYGPHHDRGEDAVLSLPPIPLAQLRGDDA